MSPFCKRTGRSSNFNNGKRFDHRKKHTRHHNDTPTTNYNRPNIIESHDFPRRGETFPPLGLRPEYSGNFMNGPLPLENSNPNYDFVRQHFDRVLPCAPDPRHDVASAYYQNSGRGFHPRDSESDSLRFHSRNEILSEGPTHGFSRNEDLSEIKPTHGFSRSEDFDNTRSRGRNFGKNRPRGGFSRNRGSVPPQSEEGTSRRHRGRSFAKAKPRHEDYRKYDDVPCTEAIEIHIKDSNRKMSPTLKRKRSVDFPRVEVEYRGNCVVGTSEKMNPSNGSSKECDGEQVNTSKVPYKAKPFIGLVTSVVNSEPTQSMTSRENFKIQKVDAVRTFPEHCGGTFKEGSTVKPNPTRDFSEIRDACSSRVEEKACENSKVGFVQKVDRSNHSLTRCVDVSSQVRAKSEPFNRAEPFEDIVTSVDHYNKPTDSALSNQKFKIRKVNAIREFPKHCGALAPRVTIKCNEASLMVKEEKNTKFKVGNDNIEVIDVEEMMKELKAADVEKVLNEPILPKNYEPAANGPELSDDMKNVWKVPILRKVYGNVVNEPNLIIDLEKVLDDEPISTNAPSKMTLDKSVESLNILKDHALNDRDDMAPIQEQNQLNSEKRMECDYYQDGTEKGKSSIYRQLFDEQPEELCSEDEGYFISGFNNKSVLLLEEDNIKPSSLVYIDDSETDYKRKQVMETKDTYERELAKLLECNKKAVSNGYERVSRQPYIEAAMVLRKDKKCVNTVQVLGHVPGIEVGDRFRCRAELVCVGLHHQFQSGIDFLKRENGEILATSIVDSGRYANDSVSCDTLVYCGEGGNPTLHKDKQPQDQELVRGNLALKNSMVAKTPVRVIRVIRKTTKSVLAYYYDGLYYVTKVTQERGKFGKLVYMFHLSRIMSREPNFTGVAIEDISQGKEETPINFVDTVDNKHLPVFNHITNKLPFLVEDISQGKEKIPIIVVNTVDEERIPVFNYITNMTYPDSCYRGIIGCDCTDCYSDSRKCRCFTKNGGEIIFDDNGAIIIKPKSKPFIYECGPSCKCLSSCKNRVGQYGIRCELEVFKTKKMDWGVRSRKYIPAGSFICEYVGELLQDEEAEQRKGSDEYLFDIDDGFTIDAANYGNVSRFINHSCSPNLYAQKVLFDHGNKRMPHVMFFAVNGIRPNQELTYDYNYKLNQVLDSNGNIKRKDCHCSSRMCTGRLY